MDYERWYQGWHIERSRRQAALPVARREKLTDCVDGWTKEMLLVKWSRQLKFKETVGGLVN